MSQIAMARFCRMLGTLLNAGVTLVNGLNVARRSLGGGDAQASAGSARSSMPNRSRGSSGSASRSSSENIG